MTASAAPGLPETFQEFVARFPNVAQAHEAIARTVDAAGPLNRKTCELIKLGISIGAGLETATRSHTRRALEAGAAREEVEQAILLAMNTCGFPRTVAAWRWARNDLDAQG
jgi:alkylhydroperoxidase/carboxymuconolactone decarboxylase family protein YurZ